MQATTPFIAAALLLAAASAPGDEEALDIREWRVPYEDSRPRDPFAESATSVWFVGQRAGAFRHEPARAHRSRNARA